MGATSDKIPPRRTGTVTATRPSAATCRAFQLSGATAMTSFRPMTLYTTPLDRGSPAGVTWLSTANEDRATARHTCSLVNRDQALPSCSRIVLIAMTAPPTAIRHLAATINDPVRGHRTPEASGPCQRDLRPVVS